ncbi:hypothetical protein [Streptomyces pinistramenti]|uniref:hypothetical protein n=1 Tax=Streptomyces pinistramenti TaxID=2884812 RepID=UPI001D065E6D|nr:hypothetical protein [Streptomyces pinistramenti]MCB5907554.1 hypothetical protein [Streptomyces pinistramenti]
MSVTTVALLLAAGVAVALGAAALHTVRALRRQLTELRAELLAARNGAAAGGLIPAARPAPVAETPLADIRTAVAEALADERERELTEARAFWAAQEARDAADTPSLLGGLTGLGDEGPLDARTEQREFSDRLDLDHFDNQPFLPRQADLAGLESFAALEPVDALDSLDATEWEPGDDAESAELAAARRRHPSHPDFSPVPVVGDHERTVARLEELADQSVPLADVRPGPLGTLDVYVFTDGTTLCLTPGHRETSESVADALRDGHTPVLLGGSGISGAYALTFAWGEGRQQSVYILADRVIASL